MKSKSDVREITQIISYEDCNAQDLHMKDTVVSAFYGIICKRCMKR